VHPPVDRDEPSAYKLAVIANDLQARTTAFVVRVFSAS
jgi:hypothetical protein